MDGSAAPLGLEPEDLDGHALEELDDYLRRGRQPADPSIDGSPACRMALDALERLHAVAGDWLAAPVAGDDDWIGRVLATLPLDVRAGRSFPFALDDPTVEASTTEGALRGLVRAVGDAVPGLLVGRVRIEEDASRAGVFDLRIDVALLWDASLARAEAVLRAALAREVPRHAPFALGRVDLRVVDVVPPRRTDGAAG